MGFLDHKQLLIIKGTGKTPTDNNSAENNPTVINLLSGPITLEQDGWSPAIPPIKNGGVWSDSPTTDGRQLIAAARGNVIEKMSINIVGDSYLEAQKNLAILNLMVQDCYDFWEGQAQIDPVYLAWWCGCGVGIQYSTIFDIELVTEYRDGSKPIIHVNMTLERENFWRWEVPPGGNPQLWTMYARGQKLNIGGSTIANRLPLTSGLFQDFSLGQKFEWTPAAAGAQTTPITKNYLEIPGLSVPGDAPALLNINATIQQMNNLYLGLTSKKQSYINHLGVIKYNALNLNIGDSVVAGTMAKTISGGTDGMLSNNSAVNLYYGLRNKTGIDANMVQVAQWGDSPTPANGITLDRNFFRGTYAVFVRASNNSAAPVLTDMDMQVTIEEVEFGTGTAQLLDTWTSAIVAVPLVQGGFAPISFMGIVTIPFAVRAVNSLGGYGLQIQEGTQGNLRVTLYNRVNVATANRIIRAYDIMFMPVDEGMVQIIAPYNGGSGSINAALDNTGYLSRGQVGQYCLAYTALQITGGVSLEVRGADLKLSPRKDYRLYVLADEWASATTVSSVTSTSVAISANIIPCSYGIRNE